MCAVLYPTLPERRLVAAVRVIDAPVPNPAAVVVGYDEDGVAPHPLGRERVRKVGQRLVHDGHHPRVNLPENHK